MSRWIEKLDNHPIHETISVCELLKLLIFMFFRGARFEKPFSLSMKLATFEDSTVRCLFIQLSICIVFNVSDYCPLQSLRFRILVCSGDLPNQP